jgi:hypothetical protein
MVWSDCGDPEVKPVVEFKQLHITTGLCLEIRIRRSGVSWPHFSQFAPFVNIPVHLTYYLFPRFETFDRPHHPIGYPYQGGSVVRPECQ